MALEAELRNRVEQSLKELEEVVGSLHHVKRLADSQDASTQQLAQVAKSMEEVGTQFRSLLESVNQAGTILQGAVDAVRAADPAVVVSRIDAVDRRVDEVAQLGEHAQQEIAAVRNGLDLVSEKIGAAEQTGKRSVEHLEKSLGVSIDHISERLQVVEKRAGRAGAAAWVAAAFAAASVIVGSVVLLKALNLLTI